MDELKHLPLVALEGAAYAGKTTLLNYLHDNFGTKVITIPEASEFVGGDKNFPDVPFKTLDDAKSSTHFFLEIEKNRLQLANKLYKKYKLPIILDRTTPVSSLIFYQLLKQFTPDSQGFIDEYYRHAISVFYAAVEEGSLVIPGSIIYVLPKNQEVFESRLVRGTKNTVFSHWDSFVFLNSKYSKLIDIYYPSHSLILDSENTQMSLANQAEKALKFVENVKVSQSKVFDNFLNENIKPYSINLTEEYIKFDKSISRCKDLIKNNNIKHDWQ